MIDEALALLELQATQRKDSIKTNYSGLKIRYLCGPASLASG
jgi:hypothetical protein